MKPPPQPKCSRCDDSGAVQLEQHVDDPRMPDGYRGVIVAYRCECSAGARLSQRFKLAPPSDRPLRLVRDDQAGA